MAKDISLNNMPVFKKVVLGGNAKEEKKIDEEKKIETIKNEDSKKQYYEMLDEMNEQENDNLATDDAEIVIQESVVQEDNLENHIHEQDVLPETALEEVVKISSEDVEVIKSGDGDEFGRQPDNGVRYKSGYVAAQLGITDQMLRNHCESFAELVEIERTASGQRQFSQENIEQLREILAFMEKNHFTPAQTVKAYKANLFFHEEPIIAQELMTTRMADLAALLAEEIEKRNRTLLEDKLRVSNEEIAEQLLEMQKRQELANENYQKIIEEKNRQITELIKKNEENEEIMRNLVESENDKLITTMREMLQDKDKDKKKSWFPWSK